MFNKQPIKSFTFCMYEVSFNSMLKLTSYMQRISDFQLENKFFLEAIFENCDSC